MRPIGDANSFARLRLDLLSQIAEARAAGDDDLAALEDALRDIEQRLAKLESRPPVIVAGGGSGERGAQGERGPQGPAGPPGSGTGSGNTYFPAGW